MPQGQLPSAWTVLAALRAPADPAVAERFVAGVANVLLKKPLDQARAARLLTDWRTLEPGRR